MKICQVDGCNNKHRCKGYCDKHYRQIRTYGRILDRTKYDPNEIIEYEDHAEIVLYDNYCNESARALIDLDDVDKVKDYKWGLKSNYVYNGTNKLYLHKLIMDCPEDMVVDHINHDTLDNRKENLRVCTQQQNCMNRSKTSKNTSGTVGVCWHKGIGKWVARIKINGKYKSLGSYNDLENAIQARKNAEIEYFGEYRNDSEG